MQLKPSKSSAWETPRWLFDRFDKLYHFETDACASSDNALCPFFYEIDRKYQDQDAEKMAQDATAIFCNPPYDAKSLTQISTKLIHVCQFGKEKGKRIVAVLLCPCKTDQEWWINCCYFATKISFIKGRLHFSGKDSAQQSHAVFTFDSLNLGHRQIDFIFQPEKKHDRKKGITQ